MAHRILQRVRGVFERFQRNFLNTIARQNHFSFYFFFLVLRKFSLLLLFCKPFYHSHASIEKISRESGREIVIEIVIVIVNLNNLELERQSDEATRPGLTEKVVFFCI